MSGEPEYVYSPNGEDFWNDELSDILDTYELKAGDIIYRGEKHRSDKMHFMPDHADIIGHVAEQAFDVGGEYAEDYPDISKKAKDKLDELLTAWAKEHLPEATFFTVHSVKEYTITQDDMP